jgi:LysM repeat protein
MKKSQRFFLAITIALLTLIAALIGLSLTLFSGGLVNAPATTSPSPPPTSLPTTTQILLDPTDIPTTAPPTAAVQPSGDVFPTNTPPAFSASQSAALLAAPTDDCPPPPGWTRITIKPGDTLKQLAEAYETSASLIKVANCLETEILETGSALYVPDVLPKDKPAYSGTCIPPKGWIAHTVKKGENLFRIGLAFEVSVAELQSANCLGNATLIQVGQIIYVPDR